MKVLLERNQKKKISPIYVLGLVGALLWVLTIFLRGTDLIQDEIVGFLLGVAPNFGVGLVLAALAVIYYPIIVKKNITFKEFMLILIAIFLLLFGSEVVHDAFLNSRFDFYDMIASLVALGLVYLSCKHSKGGLHRNTVPLE